MSFSFLSDLFVFFRVSSQANPILHHRSQAPMQVMNVPGGGGGGRRDLWGGFSHWLKLMFMWVLH